MTGNDADTISMNWATGVGQWKIHGENAYVWAAADAAAELYGLLGNEAASEEYSTLADSIQEDVLNVLWCEQECHLQKESCLFKKIITQNLLFLVK